MSQDRGTPQRPNPFDAPSQAGGARYEGVPDLALAIVSTVREALLILDETFRVRLSNEYFHQLFQVSLSETLGRSIFELGDKQWDIPELHQLLEAVLPAQLEIKDFEVRHSFPGIGERTMLLNTKIVHQGPHSNLILLAIEDVTERSAAANKVLDSEARFRAIVEASSDVVYRMSPDWKEMRFLAGRDLIADTTAPRLDWWQHYILPEDQAEVDRVIQEAVQHHKVFELEHRVRRIDGTIGWTFSRAVPMFDATGEITEWIGTAKDITKRKMDEDVLRESEEKYRSLYDSMAEGFAIVELLRDEQGTPIDIRYLELNRGFEIQTGLSRERLLGLKVSEVFPESDRIRWLPLYSHVADTGETTFFEEYVELLDQWYEVNAYYRGQNRIALFYRNVTARKHAQTSLRESEERCRSVFEHSPIGIAIIDENGQLKECNPSFYGLLKREESDVLDRKLDEFVWPTDWASNHVRFRQLVAGELPFFELEMRYTDRDGKPIWVRQIIARLRGQADGALELAVLLMDISQRKLSDSRIAADLDAMTRLQGIGSLYVRNSEIASVLEAIVDAAIAINSANCGNIHLFDSTNSKLIVAAHRGFKPWYIDYWHRRSDVHGACKLALECGKRVVVEDIAREPQLFGKEDQEIFLRAEVRSLVSTPLISRTGRRLGVFSTYYQFPHKPDERNLTLLDLLARQAADIIDRQEAEAVLHDRDEHLRSVLDAASDAIISINGRGVITSINAATERMFGYRRDELLGRNVNILMPEPFCTEHDEYIRRYQETGTAHVIGIGREAIAKRKDGSTFPIDLAVSEMDHLNQFTGIIRDITERKSLQRDVLAIADEEQRRIRQDLHDSVQQELAAVGLVAQTLLRLVERSEDLLPESFSNQCADFVKKLVSGISRAHQEVRDISRGQVSFPLSCSGLIEALQELAIRTDELDGVSCAFACDAPIKKLNSATATHLYRIAQEAVTNALKHSQPEHILIKLTVDSTQCTLQVADDGKGFDEGLPSEGMGIKTMRYRAGLIGGTLTITPVENGGTLISCRIPRNGNTSEKQ